MLKIDGLIDVILLCAGLVVIAFLLRGVFIGIASVPPIVWLVSIVVIAVCLRKAYQRQR